MVCEVGVADRMMPSVPWGTWVGGRHRVHSRNTSMLRRRKDGKVISSGDVKLTICHYLSSLALCGLSCRSAFLH